MPVAERALTMSEETLRDHEIQPVLCARHCDIEQTTLLFDFGGRPDTEVRWDTSVDDIEDEDGPPFLPLGGMDCRQD